MKTITLKADERIWGNYVLRTRYSVGTAARANRGGYSGTKVHRISISEIVAVVDEAAELAGKHPTMGQRFLRSRQPIAFSVHPACGCTQGQHSAQELSDRPVTCAKCMNSDDWIKLLLS